MVACLIGFVGLNDRNLRHVASSLVAIPPPVLLVVLIKHHLAAFALLNALLFGKLLPLCWFPAPPESLLQVSTPCRIQLWPFPTWFAGQDLKENCQMQRHSDASRKVKSAAVTLKQVRSWPCSSQNSMGLPSVIYSHHSEGTDLMRNTDHTVSAMLQQLVWALGHAFAHQTRLCPSGCHLRLK